MGTPAGKSRKKLDLRIRQLIDNATTSQHRAMALIVGDKGRDQVVILHHMLSKARVKARPSVLWCYKKELGFSSHRKKRMKQLQKKLKSGSVSVNEDDPFELFIASTNIRYCYYAETHKILGNTFGMLVLQDFEALTPNLLARTVETIEGGGLIVLLLRSMNSLKQLYTMTMDVHARYRTEAHQDVVGRFNERFILSLASCKTCLVMDDQLNILPLSSHILNIEAVPKKTQGDSLSKEEQELMELKSSLQDTQPIAALINCCKTLDQAKAVLKFIDAISEKTLRNTVTLTAARGRGKSAALGLAIAGAIAFSYSNIFVTSPSPENLTTLFEFVFKGFDALEYQEHLDYDLVQSTNPEFNKAIIRVNIFRDHRQTIQYIHPSDHAKLGQAELVVIDEAAAIPLPLVKGLMGPYLVFMASTINGYEGTGRSLSLKLIQQLRQQNSTFGTATKEAALAVDMKSAKSSATGRILHELALNESIRYGNGDPVERWLYDLLCLDATVPAHLSSGCPPPSECELYYINRDTLFCYHKLSELFLHQLMALYVASHYKNSPNDLQMLSDAPAHHLFCLIGPVDTAKIAIPEVLCVLQVCLEGEISKKSIMDGLSRGHRASGDLIPWTVAQQFQDKEFPGLSGARIVRIATHPEYQKMGYGSQALLLLQRYFEGKIPSMSENGETSSHTVHSVPDEEVDLLEERIAPRNNLPPLLVKLSERKPENLDYLGVSYGLTQDLLKFWKRSGFVPVYLRQTPNDLTGEHSCIMLKALHADEESNADWLFSFWDDFRRRFVSLLSYQFHEFHPFVSLSVLKNKNCPDSSSTLTKQELEVHLTSYDVKRLELYSNNMADYHLVMDLMPAVSRLYFLGKLGKVHLSAVQSAMLAGIGLQHKTVDDLAKELDLPASQLLGLFNRTMRKVTQYFTGIMESAIEETIAKPAPVSLKPLEISMDEELNEAAQEFNKKQKKELKQLQAEDLSQFRIRGSEEDWQSAVKSSGKKGHISVKSEKHKLLQANTAEDSPWKKKKIKQFK